MSKTADFLIIGGGVVGLTVALELRQRHPGATITVLEKEARCGEHASGRNSGVLHAGFYYTPDSLKARLTREGCRAWTEYCEEHNLPIRRCGKLVVAGAPEELAELDRLYARGQANGVDLQLVDAATAREIEPRARTVDRAIWSPTTASVDPAAIMSHLTGRARVEGIDLHTGVAFRGVDEHGVRATGGAIQAGYVINAAGLYADKIARQYGFSSRYSIVPFRGTYLYGEPAEDLRTNLYPVPDPRFPFLGVHFTVTCAGRVKVGPTAMPGLWREHYGGVAGFAPAESAEVGAQVAGLLLGQASFRRHAASEIRKLSRRHLVNLASRLASEVSVGRYTKWGQPGIRAQLVDAGHGQLVNDFIIEGDERSTHVLNAVSPAFTCAWPFAAHVVDAIENRPTGSEQS
jgi:L-2-hydroxyglutarate oxidase LhgO